MSSQLFIRDWLARHPDRKMPVHVFERLQGLNRAREILQPAFLPRPTALWAMMRFDPFGREYSRVSEVTLEEFLLRVVDPSSPDTDPCLLQDVRDGACTAAFRVGRYLHPVTLTENHLGLRAYLNHLPWEHDHNGEIGRLKMSDLATILEQRHALA